MKCKLCDQPTARNSKYCATHKREARERFYAMIREKSATRDDRSAEFDAILREAHQAGMDALHACVPTPMIVQQHANVADDRSPVVQQWYVADGACGFAWIWVHNGNSPFVRHLRKFGIGHKSYRGGWDIWVREGGQSIAKKEAYARAFADVLRHHGVTAYAQSRLD